MSGLRSELVRVGQRLNPFGYESEEDALQGAREATDRVRKLRDQSRQVFRVEVVALTSSYELPAEVEGVDSESCDLVVDVHLRSVATGQTAGDSFSDRFVDVVVDKGILWLLYGSLALAVVVVVVQIGMAL